MPRTIIDRGKEYEVYTERQLDAAKQAKKEGKRVYISRSCQKCGCELFGSNLVVMRDGPVCEGH